MKHERTFDPSYGTAVEVADGIRRLTCENPSPFTFHGTNTYLIGQREIAVLDPGPANDTHIDDIVNAAGAGAIKAILVSHTTAAGHAQTLRSQSIVRRARPIGLRTRSSRLPTQHEKSTRMCSC